MSKSALLQKLEESALDAGLGDRMARERSDAQRRSDIAELKRLLTAENHRQDALRLISAHAPRLSVPKLLTPKKSSKTLPRHTWGLLVSDWQMGQSNVSTASGGIFEQSSAITKAQVYRMWELLEQQHRIESAGKVIEELVIFSLGDLVEGDQMRPSQAAEIDNLVTKQTIDVADLEAWLINQALSLFPKVRVLHVGGNHDRVSTKAGNAGLGELGFTDTYSWLVGAFLQRMFRDSIEAGRLEIVNHESFFGAAMVAGLRCVYEHGASFRSATGSYGGVSYYSIAAAAGKYQEMLSGADLVLMGHHHKAMVLPMNSGWGWQVMNGALPPSSSWIQSSFKSVGRPTQVLIDLHETIGLVGWKPLYLDTASQLKPGEFWTRVKAESA